MPLERERGITIKLRTVRMNYHPQHSPSSYRLHMVDCPGHTDFSFEVSRSLSAVEGALLLIDASQGVQAQTIANVLLAKSYNLSIIPVINKIDLPNADVPRVSAQIEQLLGETGRKPLLVSAKNGQGIDAVLDSIVENIPSPTGDANAPLQALIFDSYYDSYRGVVSYLRIVNGAIALNDSIQALSVPGKTYQVLGLGYLAPQERKVDALRAGDIGYVTAALKSTSSAPVGDTITHGGASNKAVGKSLTKYQASKPMIFGGLYPSASDDFEVVKSALEKLKLSDSSLQFQVDNSPAMGYGFRVGYLGLLHADIVCERLRREFGVDVIATAPSVEYQVKLQEAVKKSKDEEGWKLISNPADIPDGPVKIREPYAKLEILAPEEYIGAIMNVCQERRGEIVNTDYFSEDQVQLTYFMPIMETINDLADVLKSRSKGYASMDYEFAEYRESDLVKMNVVVAKEKVEALSNVISRRDAERKGRAICLKLKQNLPRAQFTITLQACLGNKVVASESIPPQRKDVTAKCELHHPFNPFSPFSCTSLSRLNLSGKLSVRLVEESANTICTSAHMIPESFACRLWRRCIPKEEATKEASGGEEEDEGVWKSECPSRSIR